MDITYLNGKITLSSLAAPTIEDIRRINALSTEERLALFVEALERASNSEISKKSVDEIWNSAVEKAENITKVKSRHAL